MLTTIEQAFSPAFEYECSDLRRTWSKVIGERAGQVLPGLDRSPMMKPYGK